MIPPHVAYEILLAEHRPWFDDPTEPGSSVRWYFEQDGVLCSQRWQCQPEHYPEYQKEQA